jgi:hypothetical protein
MTGHADAEYFFQLEFRAFEAPSGITQAVPGTNSSKLSWKKYSRKALVGGVGGGVEPFLRRTRPHLPGRVVQLDPMKHKLKPPGPKRLKLNCAYCFQILVSVSTCAAQSRSPCCFSEPGVRTKRRIDYS